jgi:hypothetical protein
MKTMSFEKMVQIEGGDQCSTASTTASVLGLIGFGLGVAALFTPAGAMVTVLLVSQGTAISAVSILTDFGSRAAGC